MFSRLNLPAVLCFSLITSVFSADLAFSQTDQLEWVEQFGTISLDSAAAVEVHSSGDIFVGGQTQGAMGSSNAGGFDQFLQRRSSDGQVIWTTQSDIGVSDFLQGFSIESGSIFSVGYSVAGSDFDAVVSLTDFNGNEIWSQTYGTDDFDIGNGAASSSSGFHMLAGATRGDIGGTGAGGDDALLTRFDNSGSIVWEAKWGTPESDRLNAVELDSAGNSYVIGNTSGVFDGIDATGLGNGDVFVAKVDNAGNVVWIDQFGGFNQDLGNAISLHGDAVYFAGKGANNTSYFFVRKYDLDGNLDWETRIDDISGAFDSMDINSSGEIIAVGTLSPFGVQDSLLVKLDSAGNELWRYDFGSSLPEWTNSVAFGSDGEFYAVGQARDAILNQSHIGSGDAFIVKFSSAPSAPVILGDVNLDGVVGFADIPAFIAVLGSQVYQIEADLDQNGIVDFFDISPFIAALRDR